MNHSSSVKIAVVIPAYKTKQHILDVLKRIDDQVTLIYVVDDKCPDETGKFVENNCHDSRVHVVYHTSNSGVGGATITGYKKALTDGADIIVKIDSDGQMQPELISYVIHPIAIGNADYVKGNRFYTPGALVKMPFIRLVGNTCLSLLNKVSSGYWNLMDPTNGFTAVHANIIRILPLEKISKGYFFESDMLFRLNIIRAMVIDVPMPVIYGNEKSNIKIGRVIIPFFFKHLSNTCKRIFYNYYLRNFNIASIELFFGFLLLLFGITKGAFFWYTSMKLKTFASSGSVMLAALPIIIGVQFLMGFFNYDVQNTPHTPLHRSIFNYIHSSH